MQNVDNPVNIIYAALAVVGAIGSGYAWLKMQPSRDADAASVLTGAALQMVNELQEQIRDLRDEYARLNASIEQLERENKELKEQNTVLIRRVDELEKENRRLLAEKTQTRRRGNL